MNPFEQQVIDRNIKEMSHRKDSIMLANGCKDINPTHTNTEETRLIKSHFLSETFLTITVV